jgi:hypothetical protein
MEVLAPSQVPSPGPNGVANTPFAAIDPGLIYDYLQLQLKVTLGANSAELEAPGSLFDPSSYDEVTQRIARFATDSQTALYIQKELVTTDELENGPVDSGKQTPRRHVDVWLPDDTDVGFRQNLPFTFTPSATIWPRIREPSPSSSS